MALVDSIAALTGADVAASDDLTGSALLGGDWDLEYRAGDVETAIAVSTQFQQDWSHVLPLTELNNSPSPDTASATSTHTISAPTQDPLPADGKIVVTFPAGFDLTAVGNGDISSSSMDGNFTVSTAGQVLTITRSGGTAEPPSDQYVSMANTTNTSTAGTSYTVTVETQDSGGNTIEGPLVSNTFTITVNDLLPSAVADVDTAVEAGGAVAGNVLSNDTPGDAPATVTLADQGGTGITLGSPFATANGGSLTLNSDGSYSYTPPAQGSVPPGGLVEVFNYTLTDADGDIASATLTITVTPTLLNPNALEPDPEPEVEPAPEPVEEPSETESNSDSEEQPPDTGPTAAVPPIFVRSDLEPRLPGDVAAASADRVESEEQPPETLRFDLQKRDADAADAVGQLKANQRMMDALDRVREEIIEESESRALENRISVSTVEGAAIAGSVGLLGLLSRAPSLAAAALSSLPIWSRVDPLAVLTISEEERKRREKDLRDAQAAEDRAAEGVGRLLDDE